MTIYPTREEIEQGIAEFPPSTIHTQILFRWKEKHYVKQWKEKTTKERFIALTHLIHAFWRHHNIKGSVIQGHTWSYNPEHKTIFTDSETPSIISTLHELGHSLYGPSELTTCVFSIGLFKECFPIEFDKLEWDGHMLKRIIR